ncbi:hypothetical protein L6164_036948 [Bauhinia variegata]|uniref:Uncharacterized protein n=1 Tax=Bauhinia variegata TaxID=167791 RepID=A0ACB9KIN6_BAUVA|nr:hypothetical protein L6164_036948 [Bauhinia variegata]
MLQGPIPDSIGKILSLEFLDLSRNLLSGIIPKSLEKLGYLKFINLSYNRLQGEIPSDGPFVNFTSQSFVGNDGLCGRPLQPCPIVAKSKTAKMLLLGLALPLIVISIFIGSAIFLLWWRKGPSTAIMDIQIWIKRHCFYKGDVYSYGVMLMEVFTRKKPTDDMFVEGISLKSWIEDSMPDEIVSVVDSALLEGSEPHVTSAKEISLSRIMELALNCCADSPSERISMKDVLSELNKIKTSFLQTVIGSPD